MPGPLVVQHLLYLLQHPILRLHHVKSQHGTELFHGVGPCGTCLLFPCHQDLCSLRHGKSRHFRQFLRLPAYDLRIQGTITPEEQFCQSTGLSFAHKVESLCLCLLADRILHPLFHNDALLRGADGAIVEGLGPQDHPQSRLHIRRPVDVGRAVSGSHADGGLAGGVGRLDHGRSPGGQDQPDLRGTHQLLTPGHGPHGKTADGPGWRTCLLRRPGHDLHRLQGAFQGLGMGRKDDGIAGFQGNDGLVADGGGRIGAGYDGPNDPHRDTDLPDLLLGIFLQDAQTPHPPDRPRDPLRGKAVFGDLILHIAEARFPDGHFRQLPGRGPKGRGHRLHDFVQLFLRKGP